MYDEATITKTDGTVIILIRGVDTGIKMTDAEIKHCIEPLKRRDFALARGRLLEIALARGLPQPPEGKRYSFGYRSTITVVQSFAFNEPGL